MASSLADRANLVRRAAFPEAAPSVQELVNCVTVDSHGCSGGSPDAAFAWALSNGVTPATCSPYLATDGACDAMAVCGSCSPNPLVGCKPAQPAPAPLVVTQHGQSWGAHDMAAEVAARGPIVCGICVTDAFYAWRGTTVFRDAGNCTTEMHAVAISGYGTDDSGVQFWVGRNSWGTAWGDAGWFLLERGANALGVESNGCDWGTVAGQDDPPGPSALPATAVA